MARFFPVAGIGRAYRSALSFSIHEPERYRVATILESQGSPIASSYANQLGAVVDLLMRHKIYQRYPIATLRAWVMPAIKASQIKIYYGKYGASIGYITWAWLSLHTANRWVNDPAILLHASEWTDGDALWILDFVACHGLERLLLDHVRATLFADQREVKFALRNDDGSPQKILTWSRRGNAWRKTASLRVG